MTEFEFEIWRDGALLAGGALRDAKVALSEANDCAAIYGQDGPTETRFYVRQTATREELEQFAS